MLGYFLLRQNTTFKAAFFSENFSTCSFFCGKQWRRINSAVDSLKFRAIKRLKLHHAIASCDSCASFVLRNLLCASITWWWPAARKPFLNKPAVFLWKIARQTKLVSFLPEVIDANDTHTFKFQNLKLSRLKRRKD